MNLRSIYRRAIPQGIRQLRWTARNTISYIFGDRQPAKLDLDYESYWERREDENQLEMSYGDIVEWCDRLIPPGASVLDVGCGNGAFLKRLKQRKKLQELGVDVSFKAVELARSQGVNAKVIDLVCGDISGLGKYDYVTSFEVLEHIPNTEVLLSAMRVLGNQFLVTIPNTGYYLYRLRLLFGRFPRQWIHHPAEHLRFWTLTDFRLTAQLTGYEVVEILPVGGQKTLARVNPNWFAESLFFVLRLRPQPSS